MLLVYSSSAKFKSLTYIYDLFSLFNSFSFLHKRLTLPSDAYHSRGYYRYLIVVEVMIRVNQNELLFLLYPLLDLDFDKTTQKITYA